MTFLYFFFITQTLNIRHVTSMFVTKTLFHLPDFFEYLQTVFRFMVKILVSLLLQYHFVFTSFQVVSSSINHR